MRVVGYGHFGDFSSDVAAATAAIPALKANSNSRTYYNAVAKLARNHGFLLTRDAYNKMKELGISTNGMRLTGANPKVAFFDVKKKLIGPNSGKARTKTQAELDKIAQIRQAATAAVLSRGPGSTPFYSRLVAGGATAPGGAASPTETTPIGEQPGITADMAAGGGAVSEEMVSGMAPPDEKLMGMTKWIMLGVVVLGVGGYFLFSGKEKKPESKKIGQVGV